MAGLTLGHTTARHYAQVGKPGTGHHMHAGMSHVRELGVFGRDTSHSSDRSLTVPALGFLVTNATLKGLSANREAMTILTYSEKPGPLQSLSDAFDEKIGRKLLRAQNFPLAPNTVSPVIQFKSGRRIYFCRAFRLDAHGNGMVLIVLERGIPGSLVLSQLSQQFHLTQREQATVTFLLRGLTNKQIATLMVVSPNTVRAFLRMVMVKMGVSTRGGIVAKVLGLVLFSPDSSDLRAPRAQDFPRSRLAHDGPSKAGASQCDLLGPQRNTLLSK